MTATPNTTTAGEQLAVDRLRGDWDSEPVVSVYLPRDVAERLLAERGWRVYTGPHSQKLWESPAGRRYWELDEALTVALVAENA